MLTFREIHGCEGYYFSRKTCDLIRVLGPGTDRCWAEGSPEETDFVGDVNEPQFELVERDVLAPLEAVSRAAAEKYGVVPSGRLLHRQTAVQSDGRVLTQEARLDAGRPADQPKT